jgi:hypothetical protein
MRRIIQKIKNPGAEKNKESIKMKKISMTTSRYISFTKYKQVAQNIAFNRQANSQTVAVVPVILK